MEQMRRKQKFKEKERRKEQRDFYKEQVRERQAAQAHIDPLQAHDFSAVNQLKPEQARRQMGLPVYAGKASGVMPGLMPSAVQRAEIKLSEEES